MAGGNGAGNTADRLNSPWGVHVDSTNALYIVDRSNHRIQKWILGKNVSLISITVNIHLIFLF